MYLFKVGICNTSMIQIGCVFVDFNFGNSSLMRILNDNEFESTVLKVCKLFHFELFFCNDVQIAYLIFQLMKILSMGRH